MDYGTNSNEVLLRDYFKILYKHKFFIIGFVLFVLILTGAYVYTVTPIYTSSSDVLLSPLAGVGVGNQASGQNLTPTFIETQVQLFSSTEVKNVVTQKIGHPAPPVNVSEIGTTAVIEISVSNPSPSEAALIANAYANAYVGLLQNQVNQAFAQSVSGIQQEIDKTQNQIAAWNQQISSAPLIQQQNLKNELDPQISAAQQSLTVYGNELVDAQIQQQLTGQPAQVVSPAVTPISPSSPAKKKDAIFAGFIGLLLAVTLTFIREQLDDSVKSKEQLELLARPLSVVGLIPYVAEWDDHRGHIALTLGEISSPVAESFRSLRTSIQFISIDQSIRVLQITSSKKDEGKTTLVANLAVALAEAGQKVIVVSCDLRLPKLHEYFNLSNKKGLTSLILGESVMEESLQKVVTSRGDLRLLSAGPKPPNPSEILAGTKVREIIEELKQMADIVLIDTPPVLPVTDAAVLSRNVDASLVVGRASFVTKKQIKRTLEILRQVDAPLIGVVLNGIAPEVGYGSAYSYTYGYGYYDTGSGTENTETRKSARKKKSKAKV